MRIALAEPAVSAAAQAWQKSVQTLMRKLQRPRYVMVPLPEFMQKAGRDAFVANHQMPPFEKSEWKGNPDMPLEQKYQKYSEAFAREFLRTTFLWSGFSPLRYRVW